MFVYHFPLMQSWERMEKQTQKQIQEQTQDWTYEWTLWETELQGTLMLSAFQDLGKYWSYWTWR